MTPRQQSRPLSQPATRQEPSPLQAARLRWFLVIHVLAVLVIYAIALLAGGGLASTPFPPDRPVKATRAALHPEPARRLAPAPTLAAPREALVLPTAAPDLAPPWAPDGTRRTE